MTDPSASAKRSVLLFGAPGTGKGTQGACLGAVPGFFHLSSGDMFRALDKESELGKEFLKYSTKGLLVPDDFTVKLWSSHVEGLVEEGAYRPSADVLLLDGIPRTPNQVELMAGMIEVLAVVHLTCDDRDRLVQRLRNRALRSDRPDDADEDVIRRRLEVYDEETEPVLRVFPAEKVKEIDAMNAPAEVLRDILKVVAPIQAASFSNPLAGS
jgi:adenylate kinase